MIRIFALELNFMAVALRPACTKVTCPVMVATDDCQYLCAAHKRPKEVLCTTQECASVHRIIRGSHMRCGGAATTTTVLCH